MTDSPMQFIVDFLQYVDKVGIYDEYDKQRQIMITSKGVEELIDRATALKPERLKGGKAAVRMRDLTDAERDDLIGKSDRVVDMRVLFARKMAENGGARGILEKLLVALETNDTQEIERLSTVAESFTEGEFDVSTFERPI